ncbi:MAG TPA: glycoside hydrolase family 15 protein [Solirubrobacterales bacterium]|nr:glycoside hydrolase family 15 protein [Solirubrobacterales bacterium]
MRSARRALVPAVAAAAAALALSGVTSADRPVPRGLPGPLPSFLDCAPTAAGAERRWLRKASPLGRGAPDWAERMYRRSLLVLRAATDPRTGAALAGAPAGWAYVWPRDAATVALALADAGYRPEARRIVRFLLRLDLGAAARFYMDGEPVPGREAQGDAAGWAALAARAAGVPAQIERESWRVRADYQEKDPGDYLANAIAHGVPPHRLRAMFARRGHLIRRAGDPASGLDTAAAWAVEPFPRPRLSPFLRRTLIQLAAEGGRFGLLPSQDWDGGEDPWTAPTAWTAWSLAALGERRAALGLMAALRRAATPAGLLPERVDAQTGSPRSTTPLAWSHAFAVLALRELWPGRGRG